MGKILRRLFQCLSPYRMHQRQKTRVRFFSYEIPSTRLSSPEHASADKRQYACEGQGWIEGSFSRKIKDSVKVAATIWKLIGRSAWWLQDLQCSFLCEPNRFGKSPV